MIRIPDYLEIGGITYTVVFTDDIPHGRVAQIHFIKGIIEIDENLGTEVAFLSFIHEVVHGIMQSMNHFANEMIYNDEDFTERTAQLMTSIFKQLFEYNSIYDDVFAQEDEEYYEVEE